MNSESIFVLWWREGDQYPHDKWNSQGSEDCRYGMINWTEPLRNCDLPPPHGPQIQRRCLFRERKRSHPYSFIGDGTDASLPAHTTNGRVIPRITSDPKEEEKQDGNFPEKKLHLLKALQHSQTRAREAEKQASQAQLDKENVVALFFKESSRSFAYRQWLKLLEAEILMLQSNLYKPNPISPSARIEGEKRETAKTKNNRENGLVDTLWGFAGFTFCLESVGFLMGWKLANVCSIQGFDFTSIWRNLCSDC